MATGISSTKDTNVFPTGVHWSSEHGLLVVLPLHRDTDICSCTCRTCQLKLGVRLALGRPRARCLSRPLQRSLLSHGSSVQAPLLVRWASVPPTGCARLVGSLCHVPCTFPPVTSSASLSVGFATSVVLSRRRHLPPSRAVCLPNHWHPFSHSATLSPQLLFSSSQVLLHWVGLFLAAVLHAFELLKYRPPTLPLSNLLAKLPGLLEHLSISPTLSG